MKHELKWALAALPLALCWHSAYAQNQNQASVVRNTDLKAQPFSDAETIKSLPSNQKVDVVSRKASWTEVRADGNTGWLKMLSLRYESTGAAPNAANNAGSGVKTLLNIAATGTSGSTATTSVRGFRKADFANPSSPDLEALEKMKTFAVSKPDASDFALAEKLQEQEQAYVKAPGDKS